MKVMIAYDGSQPSDAAIDDLPHAGLPTSGRLLVVSVADIYATAIPLPAEIRSLRKLVDDRLLGETVDYARKETCKVRNGAVELASRAADRLQELFPDWTVWREAVVGDPESELLRRADEWAPDLIVVGPNRRGVIGRLFLNSTSKAVAEKAPCSVRVVGGRPASTAAPLRLIAAADNMPDVEKLVRAIGRRRWQPGTGLHLLVVDDGRAPGRISSVYPYAREICEQAAEKLASAEMQISVDVRRGHLKAALEQEVRDRAANAIFVPGPKEGSPLSEAALSLVTAAECTVEVVR